MRGIRLELLIATLALLASAAASIATVVQTGAVERQLSASTWPYVTISTTVSPRDVKLDVINEGLGPALIRNATLTFDGKRYVRWRDVLHAMARKTHSKQHVGLEVYDFGNGSVVRSGETSRIIGVHGPLALRFATATAPLTNVALCYCSILQQCWTTDARSPDPPAPVPDCGHDNGRVAY